MLSAVKLWKSSSMSGPSATREAHLGEDRDDLVDRLADRMDRPSASGARRQGHVDALARRARSRARPRRDRLARRDAAASLSFKRLSGGPPPCAPRRSSRPSSFISSVILPLRPSAATRSSSSARRLRRRADVAARDRARALPDLHGLTSVPRGRGLPGPSRFRAPKQKGPVAARPRFGARRSGCGGQAALASAAWASSTKALNESGSRAAMSASTLRSSSMPASSGRA